MFASLLIVSLLFVTVSTKCPQGLDPWYDDTCGYATHPANLEFSAAVLKCQSMGANLASIHSDTDNVNLRKAVTNTINVDQSFWIGLMCTGDYQYSWLDKSPYDYNNFDPKKDKQCSASYQCLMHEQRYDSAEWEWYKSDYKPGGLACTSLSYAEPLCNEELARASGKCLQPYPAPETWTNAEKTCTFSGGHLLSIHSDEDNKFVRRAGIANGFAKGFHVGMRNANATSPVWAWSDGSNVEYTNYAQQNPNPAAGACTRMNSDGTWTTIDCKAELPFICEISQFQVQRSGCSSKKSFFNGDHVYSPSFPLRVEPGECEYIVKASSPNTKAALRVESFNIHMCCHQLLVYDGAEGSKLIAKLSGHVKPGTIITGTGSEMRLVWNVKEAGKIEGWHFTVLEVGN